MKIQALHPYDEAHISEVYELSKKHPTIELKGFYDSMDDIFYLFEGCHRIEIAKRYKIPLKLINCSPFEKIKVEIPDIENPFGEPIFDENGFGTVHEIMSACNWWGNTYSSDDFILLK